MESVAEGLWGLADVQESRGEIGKAVKCLEAICQCSTSFLPIIDIKTRLRIATLLLNHTHNVNQAKFHLERAQLLLKSIPSCFDLKCRAYTLLSQCYHLVGAIPQQKNILNKALDLATHGDDELSATLWSCNFTSQLANALIIEGEYHNAISALDHGYASATHICSPELQMFFVSSTLHVHLMQWEDVSVVASAVNRCSQVWESIEPDKREKCLGLFFYNELLQIFYQLKTCDYKSAAHHVDKLDAAVKADMQQIQELTEELDVINQRLSRSDLRNTERLALSEKQTLLQEQLNSMSRFGSSGTGFIEPSYGYARRASGDKLELAPPPFDGEWLPKSAVYVLVDLLVIIVSRPKGSFKEAGNRIQSGLQTITEELAKLGITDGVKEVDLQHSVIWMAGVYLMLMMQFLENKVAVDLTRAEFVEAQQALVLMRDWFSRFPTILQASESIIEMLRGQYAHSVHCFSDAAFHFLEAAKMTGSKSLQAMCQIYAAVSYICIGDAESSTMALDLIGPIYGVVDSFVGVREKTGVLFAYGLLLMKQHNLQEARIRLATGLQITHNNLGDLQLVSQYLTVLGSLALALRDTRQAKEILKSSLTLAKKLYDIPTQIWILSVLAALFKDLGEKGSEMENSEFKKKKVEDLQKRLADVRSSVHHLELVERIKLEPYKVREVDARQKIAGPSLRVGLDIPESVGLSAPGPARPSSRLSDFDTARRGKRRL
uniref:Sister chromatid cohesion protein SCC4 n=1 Tax=Kalanchoe fedtschenkoi TaxID=63787 RepID=A0A7N0V5S2_KALFE